MNEMTRTLVVAGIVVLAMVLGGGMVYVIMLARGGANGNAVASNNNPQVSAPVKTIPPPANGGQPPAGQGRPGGNGGRGGRAPAAPAQAAIPMDPAVTARLNQLDKWVSAKTSQSTQQAIDDLRKWGQQSPRQLASLLSDNWPAKNIVARLVKDNKAYQQVIDLIDSTTASLDASSTGGPIVGSIGLGTFDTQSEYRDIHVQGDNGIDLYASNFAAQSDGWKAEAGTWNTLNGTYRPTAQGTFLSYLAGENWTNYTLTLQARKITGKEGFLIVFGHKGHDKFWWNLGGWSNTSHAFEFNGMDEDQSIVGSRVPGAIDPNRWYDIKVQVRGSKVAGYLDGKLIQEVNATPAALNDQFLKGMRHWKAAAFIELGQSEKAVDLIKQNVDSGWDDGSKLFTDIVTPLAAKKQHASVVKVTDYVLLASPDVTATVESALNQRITALAAMQNHDQALAEAKRLFNYASMEKTSDALKTLDRELQLVDKSKVDLFHKEEEQGAMPGGSHVVKSTVLAAISVNASPFQTQALALANTDYPTLLKRGALLLLADQADQAVEDFKKALSAAKTNEDKQTANTWIARSLKAQDGTIGRANDWITGAKAGATQ